jgi:hypothetical protein
VALKRKDIYKNASEVVEIEENEPNPVYDYKEDSDNPLVKYKWIIFIISLETIIYDRIGLKAKNTVAL